MLPRMLRPLNLAKVAGLMTLFQKAVDNFEVPKIRFNVSTICWPSWSQSCMRERERERAKTSKTRTSSKYGCSRGILMRDISSRIRRFRSYKNRQHANHSYLLVCIDRGDALARNRICVLA